MLIWRAVAACGLALAMDAHAASRSLGEAAMQVGGRRYENRRPGGARESYDANEMTTALRLTPFDLPLAAGLSYSLFDHSEKSWRAVDASARVRGWEVGLEVVGSLPKGKWRPYVKGRYSLAASIQVVDRFALDGEATQDVEGTFDVKGVHTNFGMGWQAFANARVTVELGLATQTFVLRRLTADGEESDVLRADARAEDFNSKAVLVGLDMSSPW